MVSAIVGCSVAVSLGRMTSQGCFQTAKAFSVRKEMGRNDVTDLVHLTI